MIAYHHIFIFTNAGIEKPCLTQSDAFFLGEGLEGCREVGEMAKWWSLGFLGRQVSDSNQSIEAF